MSAEAKVHKRFIQKKNDMKNVTQNVKPTQVEHSQGGKGLAIDLFHSKLYDVLSIKCGHTKRR